MRITEYCHHRDILVDILDANINARPTGISLVLPFGTPREPVACHAHFYLGITETLFRLTRLLEDESRILTSVTDNRPKLRPNDNSGEDKRRGHSFSRPLVLVYSAVRVRAILSSDRHASTDLPPLLLRACSKLPPFGSPSYSTTLELFHFLDFVTKVQ